MKDIYFYTRPQCPLCLEAKSVLEIIREDVPFHLHEININESEELTEKYGLMIPVIKLDGEVIQYGHADYVLLKSKLDAHV